MSSNTNSSSINGVIGEIEAIKKLNLPITNEFKKIVTENIPLIDVRAPVEFEKGAFPNAVNLPLMSDEERHIIGIRYKERGNLSAVELGSELVSPYKNDRIEEWVKFFNKNPNAYLYCFRGGQRSQISQAWMQEAGITLPRLNGGYKAFRAFLMQESQEVCENSEIVIIGGRTGSGKTIVLKELKNSIDLEALANHRGSSFGNFVEPQPSQINFENALGYALIQLNEAGYKQIIVEDESQNIGKIHIPKPIFETFQNGKLILLETPMKERVDITFQEYVTLALKEYEHHYGKDGVQLWHDDANRNLDRIKKRLGGKRHMQMKELFSNAYLVQQDTGETTAHKEWIEILLKEYYDPMYDYQISKKEDAIIFRGNKKEVLRYLNQDMRY